MLLTGNGRPPNGLFLSQSLFVDSSVDDKHDEHGGPEGEGGGDKGVRLVHSEDAFVGMGFSPLLFSSKAITNVLTAVSFTKLLREHSLTRQYN